jgi:hypothetical protein
LVGLKLNPERGGFTEEIDETGDIVVAVYDIV